MNTKTQKKSVSERALVGRLNRVLAKQDELIRKCREGTRDYHNLGDYYVVDLRYNAIVAKDIDLEEWGRKFGVLKLYEKLD